ncbi:hypothetical protein BMS3Abin03_03078 [bacterium BMS3Abin03]|nr:hypothetical protein BMS3Abin03_03078 [bacterium BMS3Abin03]
MTKILEKRVVKLKCPHCKKEVNSAFVCKMDSVIGIRYAFLCDNCQKLIGISSENDHTKLHTFQTI